MKNPIYTIIPNWNGIDSIGDALESLNNQTCEHNVVVVENGSTDGSVEFIEQDYPEVTLLKQSKNLGFAEGVNVGIRYAIEQGATMVALFNNDAKADKTWLAELVQAMEFHPEVGIVTGKFIADKNSRLDSTGDIYTTWGLPYPRGRGETVSNKYDEQNFVFGASGGASLYRVAMLKQIGLFDKNFFAYYEDVDISFRAQLAGWKVYYQPTAIAYHQIGATSSKIKGFTTYQTIKNLPILFWKNVPWQLMPTILPRFCIAQISFVLSALSRGQIWPVIKGTVVSVLLMPKTLLQRHRIRKHRVVSVDYIRSILTWDLPPNATRLRKLRGKLGGAK